jgi:RNA polymerase sigma-B factor
MAMGNFAARSDHGSGQDATGRLLHAYHVAGDSGARTRLIELYLPLVHTLARRHARGGELYEDLVQVGSIGLIKAIDRFDVARGGELAAFAVPNIAGEMKRHLRDSGTIRLPRGLAELRGRLPAAREALTGRLGREPTTAELAAELDVDEAMLASALGARPDPVADASDLAAPDSRDALVGSDDRLALAGAFEGLEERDRQILYLRFVKDLGAAEVAHELGMSERNLSRQTQSALAKLRRGLEGGAAAPARAPEKPAQRLASESPRPKMPRMKAGPVPDGARYLELPYHIVLVRNGGEGWTAQVEELPGCEAHGDTPDEATGAIRDSMRTWISEAIASDREIPEPRGASSHSGRLMLRMPQSLHAELAHAAERDQVSLNQFITSSLASAVGWRRHDHTEETGGQEAGGEGSTRSRKGAGWLGRAMVANAVLLGLAGLAAVVLLVVALTHG